MRKSHFYGINKVCKSVLAARVYVIRGIKNCGYGPVCNLFHRDTAGIDPLQDKEIKPLETFFLIRVSSTDK